MSEMQLIAAQFQAAARNKETWQSLVYNVRDYGVDNKGGKDVTSALQAIIDKGADDRVTVVIPAGTYEFTQLLQPSYSHVQVYPGANLVRTSHDGGSAGATIRNKNQDPVSEDPDTWDTNISWIGGNFTAKDPTCVGKHFAYWGVKDLRFEDVEISECYADWQAILREVEDVRIKGLYFHPDGDDLFTDGVHFNTAKGVTLTNSIIYGIDDAIAFTVENAQDGDISDITVMNCVLKTKKASIIKIAMFRMGWTASTEFNVGYQIVTTNGNIYECTVAGISGTAGEPTHTSGTAADGTVTWSFIQISNIKDPPLMGRSIDGVIISGIVAKGGTVGAGLSIWLDDRSGIGRIKNITLSDIEDDASEGAGSGMQISACQNVRTRNLHIRNPEGTGVVVINSKGIYFSGLNVDEPRNLVANGVSLQNVTGYEIVHSQFTFASGSTGHGIIAGVTSKPATNGLILGNNFFNVGGEALSLQNAQSTGISWNRAVATNRGIIEYSGSDGNIMENNFMADCSGTKISMNGPNSRVRGNIGYSDEKHNPFTVPNFAGAGGLTLVSGGTWDGWYYMPVNHGLAVIPANSGFDVAPTTPTYGISKWIVDPTASTATTFRVYFDAVPTTSPNFRFWANTPRNI